jgi:DNA adenine methylase
MHFRHLYNSNIEYNINQAFVIAIFLFIRNFAYSGMFRFNSKGEFNVPYGGIGYNKKNFRKKITYLKSKKLFEKLKTTIIANDDFEKFLEIHKPTKDDFIFLDPPYDSEFSTYEQNEFTRRDQERLANYLINKTEAKWMMIIKNTEFISNLYSNSGLNISSFDKTYLVSFMNRNNKKTEHLLIRNY